MEITISQKQARVAVTVLQVQGSVDSSNYQEFIAAARKAVLDGAEYLLIDLAACDYMSSAGIRSINEIFILFRKNFTDEIGSRSKHIKLYGANRRLNELLAISGVDDFFEIHTNLETAVASF